MKKINKILILYGIVFFHVLVSLVVRVYFIEKGNYISHRIECKEFVSEILGYSDIDFIQRGFVGDDVLFDENTSELLVSFQIKMKDTREYYVTFFCEKLNSDWFITEILIYKAENTSFPYWSRGYLIKQSKVHILIPDKPCE